MWTKEALEACKPGQGNSVNTQIYAIFMLIDMWKHFPLKFKDSIVQDQVLEEIKNSLRMQQTSSIQTVAVFGQLVELFEYIIQKKLDDYGKVTADKISNLIAHVIMDMNPSNTVVKEFVLEQSYILLKKELIDFNEFTRAFLRCFQSMSNTFGSTDMKIVDYLISRAEDLTGKNVLYLLDFNCHLFMNEACTMNYSKMHIVTLTGYLQQSDSVVTHYIKFIRLVFNWLYKTKLAKTDGPHAALNSARERQMLDLMRLLLHSPTICQRLWVAAHNLAAFTNFQLKKYLGGRRGRKTGIFIEGYKDLILASNPEDRGKSNAEKVSEEELMERFNRVFELHLDDTAAKDLADQLDQLITTVDLSKRVYPNDQQLSEGGGDPTQGMVYESAWARHKARLSLLKQKEEKLQKIKLGAFADKKAMQHLSLVREKRLQREHDKIQNEAQKSLIELEKANKYAKQVEDIKILTGTRKEDAVELTFEQLTKPLGRRQSQDSNIVDISSAFRLEMLSSVNDEEHESIRIWFNKNNLMVRGLYNHFAGKLTKIVDRTNIRITIAEILKFCQAINVDDVLNLTTVDKPK